MILLCRATSTNTKKNQTVKIFRKKFKGIYIYSSFAIQETEDRKTSFSRLHMLKAPSVTGGTFHSDEGN